MAAVLTAQQQQQVAAFFVQNVYVAQNQTATCGTDTLATAVAAMDAAVAVTTNSISAAAAVTGTFTVQQMELLLAYMLLKRAGFI